MNERKSKTAEGLTEMVAEDLSIHVAGERGNIRVISGRMRLDALLDAHGAVRVTDATAKEPIVLMRDADRTLVRPVVYDALGD